MEAVIGGVVMEAVTRTNVKQLAVKLAQSMGTNLLVQMLNSANHNSFKDANMLLVPVENWKLFIP